ncbi:hypothetical protein FRC12_022649 [Ceratobasidium sp. 428]|nr:hypothetical protein FRC12_022649 [Ceratobasidium sp. 428]
MTETKLKSHQEAEIGSAGWYDKTVCERLGYKELQPWQLSAVMDVCAGQDVFIQAPTGAGKSTIMQGAVLADRARGIESIAITLCPTKSLCDDQARSTNKVDGLDALALHGGSVSAANCQFPPRNLFDEVKKGKYTHIYIGPEMIMNDAFGEVLSDKTFYERCRYFAVDEAHMLVEWRSFRDAFADIRRLRNRFRGPVTWAAVSATVEPTRELPTLMDAYGFAHSTKPVRLPVDRPSISLSTRFLGHALPKTGVEYLDVSFVIPHNLESIDDILPTVIFASEIRQVDSIVAYLTSLLPDTIKEPKRSSVVLPMHSVMSSSHNLEVIENMCLGDCTRVLVCTDTGSLGINVERIKQVVILVDGSTTYRMLCQKIGRIRTSGRAILLFPRWMMLSRASDSDAKSRASVESVMVEFANATAERCPRVVNRAYWGDKAVVPDGENRVCCNQHHPEIDQKDLEEIKTRADESRANARSGVTQLKSDRTHLPPDSAVIQPIARKAICYWREQNLSKSMNYQPHMPASAILPERLVDLLAQKLHICTTYERFRAVMSTWSNLEEWGPSLFRLVGEIWETLRSDEGAELVTKAQAQQKEHKAKRTANQEEASEAHTTDLTPDTELQPSGTKRRKTTRAPKKASKGRKH